MQHEIEHSVWLGSVRPTSHSVPVWSAIKDHALHEIVLGENRPLVLIARNSGSSGRAGARLAAENLLIAADGLFRRTGFDVRPLLPGQDELVEILMASTNVVHSVDAKGKTFKNRFVLLDFSEHGFIVSFSTGSALKTDGEFNQPHVRWIQRLMRELRPAGFFASQFDRVSRVPWQTNMLVEELRLLESTAGSVWACDDEHGVWSIQEDADLMHIVRGQQANAAAKQFTLRGRRAQVAFTGDRMEDGRVAWARSGGVPPGLFAYRDRRSSRMVLTIDSPRYYPGNPDDVVYGLPNVLDEAGDRVDQAETVRWFLREYARPGVSVREVFKGLVQRRFSTQALRSQRTQGPSAYYGGPTKPIETYASDACQSWVRSIFHNLEFYESGVLRRPVSDRDGEWHEIRDVFPAAGFWATAEDFSRIRFKLEQDRRLASRSWSWSWSGMPVLIDGVPGVMKAPRAQTAADEVAWSFSSLRVRPRNGSAGRDGGADGEGDGDAMGDGMGGFVSAEGAAPVDAGRGKAQRGNVPALPDRLLTAALVDALLKADGLPLTPHLDREPVSRELTKARRALDQLRVERNAKQAALDKCYSKLMDDDGDPSSAFLKRVEKDYEALSEAIGRLDGSLASAQRRVDASVGPRTGVQASAMAALINGLSNPNDNALRADLREAVRGLEVQTTRVTRGKLRGTTVRVTGRLVFDVDGAEFELPFGLEYDDGAVFDVDRRALAAVKGLRQGRVARYVYTGATHTSSVLAAELLGVDSTEFALSVCHDSKLLQLGMAVMFPASVTGEDPSTIPSVAGLCVDPAFIEDFGDVRALANRIESVYTSLHTRQWLRVPGGLYETDSLIRMAADSEPVRCVGAEEIKAVNHLRINLNKRGERQRWTFKPGMWPTLTPCRFCGSTAAGAMRIREVTGYLCLNATCRRDEAGVSWPTRFDQYLSHPHEWVDAGMRLDLPVSFSQNARALKGETRNLVVDRTTKWRKLADLDDNERARIAGAYDDRTRVVKEIMTTFRIAPDTLYDIVAAFGLEPRRPKLARYHLTHGEPVPPRAGLMRGEQASATVPMVVRRRSGRPAPAQ